MPPTRPRAASMRIASCAILHDAHDVARALDVARCDGRDGGDLASGRRSRSVHHLGQQIEPAAVRETSRATGTTSVPTWLASVCKMRGGVARREGGPRARQRLGRVDTDHAACGRGAGARCGVQVGPAQAHEQDRARCVQDRCKMRRAAA